MRDRRLGERASRFGRRLLWWTVGGIVLVAAGFAVWSGTERPAARLADPPEVLGRKTPVAVELTAGRTGLSRWEVRLRDASGRSASLAAEDVPRAGLLGSGVRSRHVDVTVEPETAGFSEGAATLEVWANDHRLLAGWRGPQLVLEVPVTIDLTPPRIAVLGTQHYVTLGGSDAVLYEVDADAVASGVAVGEAFFAGGPLAGSSRDVHIALYAIPHDSARGVLPQVVARDAAGNERAARFPVTRKERSFPSEELDITDDFLRRKVPDLLRENQLPVSEDLVAGYLVVNRDLRRRSEERLREITAQSSPALLFEQGFLQQPGSQVRSSFAENRTYRYEGAVIDRQTHLGYDLASTKQAEVAAANAGKVLFTGPLGIYGDAVVIDHGLGLATLYAHLSSIQVNAGDDVARGQTIARTGETGLAGGDHLHFSVLLRGIHVDPVEWWDERWIRHHVHDPVAEVRAAAPAAPGPEAAQTAQAPAAAAAGSTAPSAAP